MLRRTVALILALVFLMGAVAIAEELPKIPVTSKSINAEGNLLTVCAYNKFTKPKGGNKSPQLSWTKVAGAKYYAISMYDTTANWVHWLVKSASPKKITLKKGAYTKGKGYYGPYPPSGSGRHNYQITVYALKKKPDKFTVKVNKRGDLDTIFKKLDTYKKKPGNVIAMGSVSGGYAYGDNTK